jgi:hypothetical protein
VEATGSSGREIGFEQVDIYFKMTEVAIFAGMKGRE